MGKVPTSEDQFKNIVSADESNLTSKMHEAEYDPQFKTSSNFNSNYSTFNTRHKSNPPFTRRKNNVASEILQNYN